MKYTEAREKSGLVTDYTFDIFLQEKLGFAPSQIAAWKAGGDICVTDSDQSLPGNPYFIVEKVGMDTETSYNKYPEFEIFINACEKMLKANFRKVVG